MEFFIIRDLCSYLQRKVSNSFIQLIEEQFNSFIQYESKVMGLEKSVKDLQGKRKKLQLRIEEETRNGKEIATNVSKWLKDVEDVIADKFWEDQDRPYAGCSYSGSLPKPGIRYRLGRTAYRLAAKVNNLCKTTFSDVVSSGLRPISIDFIFSDIDFESFDSRRAVTENITKVLKDSTVRKIGVYGPGGVGKTTLVWKVASKAQQDKLFDVVVFAAVTRNPDIRKIQGLLADQLGVRLEDESEIGRASRLRDIFMKEKRNALVILDDLWAEFDLNKLGIPADHVNLSLISAKENLKNKTAKEEGTSDSKIDDAIREEKDDNVKKKGVTSDSKMFKILLTSRSREVLSDKMDVKENSCFLIEGLQDREAEKLFRKEARVANKSLKFGPLAAKISKKCGGLPIAIVTIGRTLRNKNYSEWNDTLGQLDRHEFTEVVESVEFSTKLSFNNLENEELKSTFLLCAQLGHHPQIMDLVKYCIGLELFEGFLTIKETRAKVFKLVEKLKDSSLLLNSYYIDRFNMHDTIRDVALSIAYKERHFFTMRNQELREWPLEFKMHNAISIHKCDIYDKLPNAVSCPGLKFFHVDSLDSSFNIPQHFFKGLRELRALILTGIDMSNFSASIECLTNLRMLCLEQCTLGDISFIGELEKLRILSLSGSKFNNLPAKLGQLCKLQLLDISNCFELREIPHNVLPSLYNLEELYMRNSVKWENNVVILAELRHLHQLKNLDICIPSATILPQNLFLDKLDRYKIVIGDFEMSFVGDFKMPDKDEASRVLAVQIKENNLNIHSQKGIKMLFKRVEKLLLGEINGVQDILYELNLEGFPHLKQLFIVNNSNIECIIKNSKVLQDRKDAFPNLELLRLHELKKIENISSTTLAGTSFSKLKVVKITNCEQLKNIFSLSMVKLLGNLETIDVSNCDSMENIVSEEEHDAAEIVDVTFAELRSLSLQDLWKFSGVYSNGGGGSADICLFNDQVAIPKLESLELYSIQMHKIWSSQPKRFENLMKLNVTACGKIKYLFSFSMATSLKNLKSMSICQCHDMVEIFKYEDASVDEARIFPNLEEIHIRYMLDLTDIWPRKVSQDSFPSLNSIFIERCGKLDKVFPSHMVGRYGRLESLKIVHCDNVEEIFDLDGAGKSSAGDETRLQVLQIHHLPKLECVWNKDPKRILSFRRLHSIEVIGCDRLQYLFPVSVANGLQELDSLNVCYCDGMKEIVQNNAGEEGPNEISIPFVFPKVTVLAMRYLPKLESFYKDRHMKCPKLKKLSIIHCGNLEAFKTETTNSGGPQIFLPEEIISNLETMEISQEEAKRLNLNIENFWMSRLNDFALTSCPSASGIEILYWLLHRMPSLERLTLSDCKFKELIPRGSLLLTQPEIGNIVQFKYLRLLCLSALKNIGFERDPILQCLEHLYIKDCPNLINLAPSSVTLTHLTSLEIHGCLGLKNLMGFSIAKSLVQLMSLKVIECQSLNEIVAGQKDEVKTTSNGEIIEFRKLKTLELGDLLELCCFCSSEIYAFKFPLLEKVVVRDCRKMTRFCEKVTTPPNLQVLEAEEEEKNWYWKGDLNATILKIFIYARSDLGYAQHLKLYNCAEIEELWRGEFPLLDISFRNLQTLVVENCEFISNVIPSHLLPHFHFLQNLEVRSCRSVVAIFDVDDNVKAESFMWKLTLDQLPNMKHVWSKNPQGILSFEYLYEVQVIECDCLQSLFPSPSFANSLSCLSTLEIKRCAALVEIVGKVEASEEEGAIEEFKFKDLTSVTLVMLPKLKYFYSRRMKLRCPNFTALNVYHCDKFTKLQKFVSESESYQGAVADDHIDTSNDSQYLYFVKEALFRSPLEQLSLTKEEAMILCYGNNLADHLKELKHLRLHCFHNDVNEIEADEFPFEILHSFPRMQILAVACSYFTEIFPPEPQLDFAQLKYLRELIFEDLSNLNCIGLEHHCMDSLREKLQKLWIARCPCLTKLVKSPVCFPDLQDLLITQCDRLEYLFTTRTARNLRYLRKLSVSACESIREIIVEDRSDATDEVMEFILLGDLILDSLPSLACFYTGTSSLQFSSLTDGELKIDECPNITFFSQGSIYVPNMQEIPESVSKDDWRIDGSIHSSTLLRTAVV